jgi:hypothetical protein
MKYRVEVCSTVLEWRWVEVEAGSEEEAGQRAIDRICDPEQPDIPVERTDGAGIDAVRCYAMAAAE